jgi:hypothetical protein
MLNGLPMVLRRPAAAGALAFFLRFGAPAARGGWSAGFFGVSHRLAVS